MRPSRPITILAAISHIGKFGFFIYTGSLAPGAFPGWLCYQDTAFSLAHVADCIVLPKLPRTFTPGASFRGKLNKGGYHGRPP